MSLFGEQGLGTCPFRLTAVMDGAGRIVIDSVTVDDASGPACGDMLACRQRLVDPSSPSTPWHGRAVATGKGGLEARVDVCLDTCFGRFEGTTRLRMTRTDRGWRLSTRRSAVGVSGLEIAGSWELER